MSLLDSLKDKNRHSEQPNSFAAVQTTWNSSGIPPPKPKQNLNNNNNNNNNGAVKRKTSTDGMENKAFKEEMSRLNNKISTVANTVGALYNQINILAEATKKNPNTTTNNNNDKMNDLNYIVKQLEKIINNNNTNNNNKNYNMNGTVKQKVFENNVWRDVSYFMMGVSTISILSSVFVLYMNRK